MTNAPAIPFNRPSLEGRELAYIREAVENGHTSASGPFAREVQAVLRKAIGAQDVLLTTSCTDALEMTAMLMGCDRQSSVIVPSFTFVSTALAYARQGARLLFCDIEPVTLGMDPSHLAELMDDSVCAVVPVHYAGVGCDIDGIAKVLEDRPDVHLVEDNAHGLFGSYRDRPLGSFGRFSTLSFHETKNFLCGEGGALVLNDANDVERAHVLYDKGTNRRAFLQGQTDKYTWQDIGSSFGLSDVLAGYLLGQLEERERILGKRKHVWSRYQELLAPHAEALEFTTPVVPPDRHQAYHMYYLLLRDHSTRDSVLEALREEGLMATFHYVPLHSAPGAERYLVRRTSCPVTDDVSDRLIRLPFFNGLTDQEIERVVEALVRAHGAPTG